MYERRLADENTEKVKLRGQAGIFRQRYEDAKEQAEQLREAARTKEERAARLKAVSMLNSHLGTAAHMKGSIFPLIPTKSSVRPVR